MSIRGVLKMIVILNMKKPKECWECLCINDSDCQALELLEGDSRSYEAPFRGVRPDCPIIEIDENNPMLLEFLNEFDKWRAYKELMDFIRITQRKGE